MSLSEVVLVGDSTNFGRVADGRRGVVFDIAAIQSEEELEKILCDRQSSIGKSSISSDFSIGAAVR